MMSNDFAKSGCTIVYESRNNRKIQIQDLHSAHLINILKKMIREAKEQAFEDSQTQSAKHWTEYLPEQYAALEDEAIYRQLDWR
jgi:hypothetical protein